MITAVQPSALYVHAVIPRLGLGNSLFPWARAEVFRHRYNLPMLSPLWFKPTIGPFLRRETDKRVYWSLFRPAGYVHGLRRLGVLCVSRRVPEPEDWFTGGKFTLPERGVVIFRGLKPPRSDLDYFQPFSGQSEVLRRRLHAISRSETLRQLSGPAEPFIGVHLRRGDLAQSLSDPRNPIHSPPEWFVAALRRLLEHEELSGVSVKIMTDGDAADRRHFAEFPRVEFVNKGNAVANILFMARALVFLGTGYSTFSRWISFLGGMPTLYFPRYVPPGFGHEAYNGGFDPAQSLPPEVWRQIANRLGFQPTALSAP